MTRARRAAPPPGTSIRLASLLDEKQVALEAAESALATAPAMARALIPEALRARAHDKVVHLAEVLRRDIPAGREAHRSVLAGPAEAVPILVNGAPRFLVRAKLSASAVLDGDGALKANGDPNGI